MTIPLEPILPTNTRVLGSVVCTPSRALAGESVRVEVRGPGGKPYDNNDPVPITINGTPGSTQYISWSRPGSGKIIVLARGSAGLEKLNAAIEIDARSDGKTPPSLRVDWLLEQPGRALLSIVDPPLRQLEVPPDRPKKRIRGPRTPARTVRGGGGDAPTTYTWDFGDGVLLGTVRSSAWHDYLTKLSPSLPYGVFHVTATVSTSSHRPIVVRRSIVLHNPYYLAKERGVLQPPVVQSDSTARFRGKAYRARMTVWNPESVDIVLTGRRIERFHDGGRRDLLDLVPVEVVLPQRRETVIDVFVKRERLPSEIESFAVHYVGRGPGRAEVRVVGHFDLPEHIVRTHALPQPLLAPVLEAVHSNRIDDSRSIRGAELRQITRKPAVSLKHPRFTPSADEAPNDVHALGGHDAPELAIEGTDCDPWNLPDDIPEGLFCMPTSTTERVLLPPRFMNARKGDLVLSPGDGGLVAKVLASVSPPQPFSHSLIMTRNRDEVTHSTAAMDRVTATVYVGPDGIRPDVLKYLWPGVIIQTVEAAVFGEALPDPENKSEYTVAGITMVGTGTVPVVVKPNPFTETSEIREKLHQIADFAWQQAGKSHYRFFCYTDPATGLTEQAPVSESAWAIGTFPTVCSSLIWMAIRDAGVTMEGGLETVDMKEGAHITSKAHDGLYLYDAAERLAAGEVLYGALMGILNREVSDFENFMSDVREDIANQILNAFESDWTDYVAGNSDRWRRPDDANAVSPMNLLFYDKPFYGASETLIFRDARVEEVVVHRWKQVAQTGTITGIVKHNGKAVKRAEVQVTVKNATHSGNDGRFKLTDVPAGEVIVEAQKEDGGILLLGQKKVKVSGEKTKDVIVNLAAPSHLFRRMHIEGWMVVEDYDWFWATSGTLGAFSGLADLDRDTGTHVVRTFDHASEDAYGRLILSFDLHSNDEVDVTCEIRCYDANNPFISDYHRWTIGPSRIKPGQTRTFAIYTDDDNYARAEFTVTNKTNQS